LLLLFVSLTATAGVFSFVSCTAAAIISFIRQLDRGRGPGSSFFRSSASPLSLLSFTSLITAVASFMRQLDCAAALVSFIGQLDRGQDNGFVMTFRR
jgi:hypothetical protein